MISTTSISVHELIGQLRECGAQLWIEDDTLHCRAPKGVLTPALTAQLREQKADILAFLRHAQQAVTATLPAIQPVDREALLAVSFAQQRLWFLEQLEGDSRPYTMAGAFQLNGPLDVVGLEHSFQTLIERHEILRTTFAEVDAQLVQVIRTAVRVHLERVDLQTMAEAEQRQHLQQRIAAVVQLPFDLAHGPLVRGTVFRLGADTHVLLLTVHHIVFDGWSIGIFLRELAAVYEAFVHGQSSGSSVLDALPVQYADFANWQRQWLQGEELQTQLAYWKHQLAGAPGLLSLPLDHPRPTVQTFQGHSLHFTLTPDVVERLQAFSQRQGVSLFMTLLAAYTVVLARYSGQEDIVVGSPIANRRSTDLEGLLGCFVNTLVLRTDVSGNPTFSEVARRVSEVALDAYAHQDVPFELLVEELQSQRNLAHSPLFQVMFDLQPAPPGPMTLAGVELLPMQLEETSAKFDLSLSIEETRQGLRGVFEYNTDVFVADSMQRLCDHYQAVVVSIVTDPQQRLYQIDLLSPEEKHHLVHTLNQTQLALPSHQTVVHGFEAQVELTPDRIAVVCEDDSLSYAELNARANQVARSLRDLGVGSEVLVGICVERSIPMLIGLLGILKAGGAYVPLDPAYPQERLAFMLEDTRAPVLVTQSAVLSGVLTDVAGTRHVVCLDTDWDTIARQPATNLPSWGSPDNPAENLSHNLAHNLAYVIYTSGSTGRPKGVMISHHALSNHMAWMQASFPMTETDSILQKTPFSFDASVWEFYAPLLAGGRLILAHPTGHQDTAYLLETIATHGITTLQVVPSLLGALVEESQLAACSSLQRVFCGGEALPAAFATRLRKQLDTRLYNLYGPTEACIDASMWPCDRDEQGQQGQQDEQDQLHDPLPIGRPIANTQLYILDPFLQPVPIGIPGELYIGGSGLARGYYKRPQLTPERFIPHPFSDTAGARLYRTGDIARYLSDGTIAYLGRSDQQLKVRGFRIELQEIETVLAHHPDIQEAVVLVQPDQSGPPRLIAYLVPTSDASPSASALRLHLKASLPDYMIPAAFVVLEALPLSPSGKIDRRALMGMGSGGTLLEATYVPPQTALEQGLAHIWEELLHHPRIGREDNFFDLGGHSLLATQLLSRIRDVFGIELPLRRVFEYPSLQSLAACLTTYTDERPLPPITSGPHQDHIPLSFAQERLFFLNQLVGESIPYHIAGGVRLRGRLDRHALERSVVELVRRHQVLRTIFPHQDGVPMAQLLPVQLRLPVVELRHAGNAEQAAAENGTSKTEEMAEVEKIYQDFSLTPFDLATGPLFTSLLVQLGDEDHVLLVNMHHIISDGWSMGILIQEVSALYGAFSQDAVSPLPELPLQYADFAQWQRQWLSGAVLDTQRAYWRQQFSPSPALLELPTDRPRPAIQGFRGKALPFTLPAALGEQLQAVCQDTGTTLFMLLLAGFATLLHRYSGQDDIVIGAPIANRRASQTEALIGFFVNTLALRIDLHGTPGFRQLLSRVRQTTLDAYAHQDLPFEQLVEDVQPQRNLSHHPLFQVMFVLQNVAPATLQLPGLELSPLDMESHIAKFDLSLEMEETPHGLAGRFEYNTDLFDTPTIARMVGHLQNLLHSIAQQPEDRLADLSVLSPAERRQLLVEWNTTQRPITQPCFHDVFTECVQHNPESIALVFEDQQLTYRELNRRASQLAHYLQSVGIGPDTLVGICLERSLEMIISVLGVWKAGGAYVPLDPAYPRDRVAFILADTRVSVVLTQAALVAQLPDCDAYIVCVDRDWSTLAGAAQNNPDNPVCQARAENLAYVIYTSGSTGTPKGAMVSHAGLWNLSQAVTRAWHMQPDSRIVQWASFSFDASVAEIVEAFGTGACLCLASTDTILPGPPFSRFLQDLAITHLTITPSALASLAPQSLPAVQTIVVAGEACPAELVATWSAGRHFFNAYGPTEASVCTSTFACDDPTRKPSIGRPIDNFRVYVLDRALQPVPIGVPGELYIESIGLARGYLARPGLTAEKFVANPFGCQTAGSRVYKTGDLVRYLPDGNLDFLGRMDHQVKLRGHRIELGEIEYTLRQHAEIAEAIVIPTEQNALAAPEAPEVREVALAAYFTRTKKTELWPSIAEFFVYDDVAYRAMSTHHFRNQQYLAAFHKVLSGATVVEIGPGPEAILSRLCLEAGAEKVYAIERLESTYNKAKETITSMGLEERIILIHGDATQVDLPHKVDYCVSEIVGSIGGAEGAAVIINSAKRFLHTPQHMLPQRSVTKIAAISLPESDLAYGFSEIAAHYVEKIFAQIGYPFDLRLCLKNASLDQVISTSAVFEELDYTCEVPTHAEHEITLEFHRHELFYGFLVWLELHVDEEYCVDTLDNQDSWLPVYIPIFVSGVEVSPGDVIRATIQRRLSDNGLNPDYDVQGRLIRHNEEDLHFQYQAYHSRQVYRHTPFYDRLFADDVVPVQTQLTASDLRSHISTYLPHYMLPSYFVELSSIPLTPNGKIDRAALPAPSGSRATADYIAPHTPVEQILIGIWTEVLGLERIGVYDDFFELGGHSLLAMRAASRLSETFEVDISVRSVFEAPTIAGLAETLQVGQQAVALPPLSPITAEGDLPLSFAQQRMWFLNELDGPNPAYHIAAAVRLTGVLHLDALERSLHTIGQRHAVLRSSFSALQGVPSVRVSDSIPALTVCDLHACPAQGREAAIRRFVHEETQAPFDLSTGPLLRTCVLQVDEHDCVFVLTMHHIVSDGWSMGILVRELSTLYTSFVAGQTPALAALPIQYTDYVQWQNQCLSGDVLANQRTYWQHQLAGAPDFLDLPTDHPRPPTQTFRGSTLSFAIPAELQRRVQQLSQQSGVTLFMTLLAVYAILLARYSRQQDILIGTPVANRNRVQLEPLIGFFVNTLIIRARLEGNPDFVSVLRHVRHTCLEAYAHQDVPFELLVEDLQPQRELSHSPLFQTMFVFESNLVGALELADMTLTPLHQEQATSKFDITLFIDETEAGGLGTFEYRTDLFDHASIRRMAAHFILLLEGIVANPHEKIENLPVLTADEYQAIQDWNQTARPLPHTGCFHQLFEDQVCRTPDSCAAVSDEAWLSYGSLNARANQLAHYLHTLGVGPETLVAVCIERSLDMLIGLLGIMKAGGAYVPLDPDYPSGRLAYMLADAEVSIVLTQEHLAARFQNMAEQVQTICLDTDWANISGWAGEAGVENPACQLTPENLAYVMYTSGSTGNPKGSMITHTGLVNYVSWAARTYTVTEGAGTPVATSFSFDATITSLLVPLVAGQKLVLLPPQREIEVLSAPEQAHSDFSYYKLTPSHLELLNAMLDGKPDGSPAAVETSSEQREQRPQRVRSLILGGEALTGEHLSYWRTHAPRTRVYNEYGPTETVVGVTIQEFLAQDTPSGKIPIGKPIANTQIYIFDAHLQPVPIGVVGEIYIGGLGLARGYFKQPGLTADKFRVAELPHPNSVDNVHSETDAVRVYKSGDLGRYLLDGTIEYVGRSDTQVKIRGYRIECDEIESVLRQHPGVRAAVVLAREDTPGDRRLVAYYVPHESHKSEDSPLSSSALSTFLAQVLPDYMLPAFFVSLSALPLTPNGKVDRQALPPPAQTRPDLEKVYVAPRTPTEEELAAIWGEVLGLDQVGINDHFFELGGHSLLATQVMARIRTRFAIDVPLARLFEAPTIAGLALLVSQIQLEQQDAEEAADLLAEIQDLSEADLEQLLREESQAEELQIQDSQTEPHALKGEEGAR